MIITHRLRSIWTNVGQRTFTDLSVELDDGTVYGGRFHNGLTIPEAQNEARRIEALHNRSA